MVAAVVFEEPDVEPMVFHVAAPGVIVTRLRLRPRENHPVAGPAVAFLEARTRCAWKPSPRIAQCLDVLALAAQRLGRDLDEPRLLASWSIRALRSRRPARIDRTARAGSSFR